MPDNIIGTPQTPGGPGQFNQPLMNEEEMRNDLERDFSNLDKINGKITGDEYIGRNKIEGMKKEIMQRLFKVMIKNGVNPNDLNSINRFLQSIQNSDPDLAVLFETAINALSGAGEIEGPAQEEGVRSPEEEGSDLTDKFSNIQEDILRK